MNIEQALYSYLSGYSGLTAIVGYRIYPVIRPKDSSLPAVVFQKISDSPFHTLEKDPSFTRSRFQFTGWAKDIDGGASGYAQCKDIAAQLKAALRDYSGTMGGVGGVNVSGALLENESDGYEDSTDEYRCDLDFFIFHEGGD
ncbi:MAG: DUF3168 domain-containing protein [Sphaerochaeta sp.]|jgi:hypothetical protein|nr:DUF3168 domain-containing protein [Sphaerochaeta sp.]